MTTANRFTHGSARMRHWALNNLQGSATTPTTASRTVTGTAQAGWRFGQDGQVDRRQGSYSNGVHNWLTQNPNNSLREYQIKATKQSGTNPNVGYALNTWFDFTTATVNWEHSNSVNGTTRQCVLKIEIREKGGDVNEAAVMVGYYEIIAKDTGGGTTTTTTSPPTTTPPTTATTLPPTTQ